MIYVLADIHGRSDRFDDILDQIKLTDKDNLYILGDVIDRNPDGIDLLQRIMQMKNCQMILGNHEHMMMDVIRHPGVFSKLRRWYSNGGEITHEKLMELPELDRKKIYTFIEDLPLNIEITVNGVDYVLVHGVPESSVETLERWMYDDLKQAVVWERINGFTSLPDNKTTIFGHTPTSNYQDGDPMRLWHGDKRIGIDCGAAYPNGRLGCLRLDDMEEFYSRV